MSRSPDRNQDGAHDARARAELPKRTRQTDVLTCPRCGGTRRVVAVVLR